MAVTPVRTSSPSTIVTCPTRTPATSVMALSGPGSSTPGRIPSSRARGRAASAGFVCASASPRTSSSATAAQKILPIVHSIGKLRQRIVLAGRHSRCNSLGGAPSSEETEPGERTGCAGSFAALHSARPEWHSRARGSAMTRLRKPVFRFLFSIFFLGLALPAATQSLQDDLAKFVETPAVPGYEKAFAGEIRSRVKNLPLQADNLGNLYVTLGRGAPHRLIVTPMDEPGYVVSGITADGYLRVQRLPQVAPHPQFDLLHAAQPAAVYTRKGKRVPGVFAGLSTHLQPSRQNAPRGAHPDEMYIDIGASSPAEVNQAGVALLDPVALDRQLYAMGYGRLTAPSIGDRFGCAALVELLRRVEPAKLHGTLTVAFVAEQWANSRGLDRLTQHVKADEMIYVGRMLPRRATNRQEAAAE